MVGALVPVQVGIFYMISSVGPADYPPCHPHCHQPFHPSCRNTHNSLEKKTAEVTAEVERA